MDNLIQKIAFMVVGAVLLFTSYVLWSPGTFGLCEEPVRLVEHNIFGQIERCTLISASEVHKFAGVAENIAFIIIIFFTFSFLFNSTQFRIFRNLFLIGLVATILFIYFFPNFDVAFGSTFEITHRTRVGSYALAVYSAVGYIYALIKGRAQKAS